MELPEEKNEIIAIIEDCIHKHGLSIRAFEREADLPKDTVRSILRGLSNNPRADTYKKILAAIERIKAGNTNVLKKPSRKAAGAEGDLLKRIKKIEESVLQLSEEVGVHTSIWKEFHKAIS